MLGGEELTRIEARKRVLLLESEVNRITLRLAGRDLMDSMRRPLSVAGALKHGGLWLIGAAPVAGAMVGMLARRKKGLLGMLGGAVGLAVPLVEAWLEARRRGIHTPEMVTDVHDAKGDAPG